MIGIIGGSGLYDMEGLENTRWQRVTTPFGNPSDELLIGRLADREVAFLPRHGRGHRILPSELNHRANIWALKSLGVRFLISVGAVGSLQARYRPLDIVVPDQFFDRTKQSLEHTFFGEGIVAHVGFGDPVCRELQKLVHEEAVRVLAADAPKGRGRGKRLSADLSSEAAAKGEVLTKTDRAPKAHRGGTYVNMEGPAFSTRAESNFYRSLKAAVIGMTNLGEAKLAREAEMAYTTIALVTDYDCWKMDEAHVTVAMIIRRLRQNAANAKSILRAVIPRIDGSHRCACHDALRTAIITDKKLWPAATVEKLKPILGRYL